MIQTSLVEIWLEQTIAFAKKKKSSEKLVVLYFHTWAVSGQKLMLQFINKVNGSYQARAIDVQWNRMIM